MKKWFLLFVLTFFGIFPIYAQRYSAYTSYGWDEWHSFQYYWHYTYSDGWVYAVPRGGNIRDFYFRFKKSDLQLHELEKKEWKLVKDNEGWIVRTCTFEYYVTDDYPTINAALKERSWPCAKYYQSADRPIVLRSEKVKCHVYYSKKNLVSTLNFHFSNCSFALSTNWTYKDYNMTYTY